MVGVGRGGWDECTYMTMCKVDNRWGPTIKRRGLISVPRDDLEGRAVQEGGDTCVHAAE